MGPPASEANVGRTTSSPQTNSIQSRNHCPPHAPWLPRSQILGNWRMAWRMEADEAQRRGRPVWSPLNRFLQVGYSLLLRVRVSWPIQFYHLKAWLLSCAI